jgi:hypothetical protein
MPFAFSELLCCNHIIWIRIRQIPEHTTFKRLSLPNRFEIVSINPGKGEGRREFRPTTLESN